MAANTTNANQTAEKMAEEATKRMEENTERLKEFNSSMMDTSKAGTRVVVDNYEKAAKNFYQMQRQMAETSNSDLVKHTTKTQIQFAEEVTDAWVKAARNLLK